LLPFPLIQMAKKMMAGGVAISMTTYALVTVGWCLVYYFAGRVMLQKRDW
jgi:hypothetical protein